jgi:PLP dependent protein
VLDLGESRDQEARAKIRELAGPPHPPVALRWHVVGRLQTNKARSVVGYAHAVHSLDRIELATALADAAARESRPAPLGIFVQASLDSDPRRGGVPVGGLPALADAVAAHPELRLLGIMAVAPQAADPEAAFAALAELSDQLRGRHPEAVGISAGMSSDLEAAVRHGATHVRVGTALLGRRSEVFG